MVSAKDTFVSTLQIVHRTLAARTALVQDMGVHDGGLHILVAQVFRHGPNIVAAFQELRGKQMPKGMACGSP